MTEISNFEFLDRARSRDEIRPEFAWGHFIELDNDDVAFAADGYRLHLVWNSDFGESKQSIEGYPIIQFDPEQTWSSNFVAQIKKLEERTIELVLPLKKAEFVECDAESIRETLVLSDEVYFFNDITITPDGKMYIWQNGLLTEIPLLQFNFSLTENLSVTLNPKYVLDALPDEGPVRISIHSRRSNYGAIGVGEWGKRLAVIMPMADYYRKSSTNVPLEIEEIGGWGTIHGSIEAQYSRLHVLSELLVIKVSGHEIDDPDFLTALAKTVRDLDTPTIIVHGGGKEISALQNAMGIEPHFIDGVRVTDEQSLSIVEMVISGVINKRLVRALAYAGVDAMGISGSDRGLLRAVKYPNSSEDMMFTGEIKSVRAEVLDSLLAEGITPVVAPVCIGEDSATAYNVNADHVAGAIAAAVQADRIVFLSNVEAVLKDDKPIHRLDAEETQQLIEDGTINGGMIPKVRTALDVLERGVPEAVITNLQGLGTHGGTVFSKATHSV